MSSPSSIRRPLRIVLIGGAGQLGAELQRALVGHEVQAPGHEELDVVDARAVGERIVAAAPDWVINCAAYHDVDQVEDEPRHALEVNAVGPLNVARAAAEAGARVAYVSTDYVFAGDASAPYVESDATGPCSVYGVTKLAGEAMTRAVAHDALVLRTAGLYGRHPCRGKPGGRNFVDLMLRIGRERGAVRVVDCETVSPTYAAHAAGRIRAAIDAGLGGILHVAATGAVTWREFAIAIFAAAKLDVEVATAGPDEFPKKAPRPAFSALGSERDAELGGAMPGWRQGLSDYLAEVVDEAHV